MAGDPRLRTPSRAVDKFDKKILSLIKDMKETLTAQKNPEGIGLAAPQIGKNIRIFLMMPDNNITVVANPVILSAKATPKAKTKTKLLEGCLSLPHYYGPLIRSDKVQIEYLNDMGQKIERTFTGLEAQIVQHEIDHLNGILFVDRLLEQKKPLYEHTHGEWEEVELT